MKLFDRKIELLRQNPVERSDATGALCSQILPLPTLAEQLDLRQPLKKLADSIPWSELEEAFGKFYSEEGRPAKSVRLMVGLLLLKQMFNQGDETVVAGWVDT